MLNLIGLRGLTKEHMKSTSVKEINSALYVCYIFLFSYFAAALLSHYCVFNVFYYVFMVFYCVILSC